MARVSNSINLNTGEVDGHVKTVESALKRMEALKGKGKKLSKRGDAARGRSREGFSESSGGLSGLLGGASGLARGAITLALTKLVDSGLSVAGRRENGETFREIVRDMIPDIASSIPIVGTIRQLAQDEIKRNTTNLIALLDSRDAERDVEKRLQNQPSLRREAARTASKQDEASFERQRIRRQAALAGLR